MLSLEDAQQRILAQVEPLASEDISLGDADGRILAASVVAPVDLPGFDNSAMDGYAVRSADVQSAKADAPVSLRIIAQVAAGERFDGEVQSGTCVRLFTGSPLPRGADAVVMQEDARPDAAHPDNVLICDTARPWEHVRLKGEDVKRGETTVAAGLRLNAGRLGLLAALGIARVTAGKSPVIGLLATGSELRTAGEPLQPGQIYESNRTSLASLLRHAGATPKIYPLVPDTLEATQTALQTAFAECDAVITSGGVSVGGFDFVKDAFRGIGGELDFWRVAIKPGKPFVFGRCRGRLLFGLPGNPVSALVTYLMLVRPAILKLQGARQVFLPSHPGILGESLANRGDRRHFVRVVVDEQGNVRSAGTQASHMLGSLSAANGLVDVPPLKTLATGAVVKVLYWE
ncbi:MAG: gephyrin-like molybdotransferase Glp [Verrucomicrobiota bacterium]